MDEDRELADRKTYREKHKRSLRPNRQLEPAQNLEWDREMQWMLSSVTMVRMLRDGVLSIVDEDHELAMRKV